MATENQTLQILAFSMKVGTLAWAKLILTPSGTTTAIRIEGSDVAGMPVRPPDIPNWADNYFRGIDAKSCNTHVAVIDTSSQVHMPIVVALAQNGFHVFKIKRWSDTLRYSKDWVRRPSDFAEKYKDLFNAHKHQAEDGSFRCAESLLVAVTIGTEYLRRRHSGDLEGVIEIAAPKA